MIQAKARRSERQYRLVDMDSSSSLKLFSDSKRLYYKKYIDGKPEEEEITKAAIIGSLVDCMLLEPDTFDERYFISAGSKPTGLMNEFVEALYKHTMLAIRDDGTIGREFIDIAKDAYEDSGFKQSIDVVLNNFVKSGAESYYNELRQVRPKNLTVITLRDVETANGIIETLKTDENTYEIVNQQTTDIITVLNQLQIEGVMIHGLKMKGMLDKVIIDHAKKTIQIYDLKCVWEVERFYEEYYLYRKAYIQAYVYTTLINIWKEENDLEGYLVLYPRYIVCDSANWHRPIIYQASPGDILEADEGFNYKHRHYTGVRTIIEELLWSMEYDAWDITMKNHLRRGISPLKSTT